MPTAGQEVTFTWNVTAFAIGQILVVRTGFTAPISVSTLITETHNNLPTTVDGTFTDNPGAGIWRYSLLYTVSLDPDVLVEVLESVDSVTVTWPTGETTDSNWSFVRQENPPNTEDGSWSTLEPFIPPTTDSTWSSFRQTAPTEDGLWSFPRAIISASGPSSDSNWSGIEFISILPGQNPPILRPFSDWIIEEGESFILDMDNYGSDADGDALTYTVTSNNAFTSVVAGSGNRYTFQGQSIGVSTITVVVSDGTTTATQTFTVTVVAEVVGNRPPFIDELAVEFVEVGTRGDKSFVNQRGLGDPDGDYVRVLIEFVANPLFHAFVSGGDTIFIEGLKVGIGQLTVIPVDEHGLRGPSATLTIVVYQTTAANRPPVCIGGPRIGTNSHNTGRHRLSIDYDLSPHLSDPDNDRVFVSDVDYDNVHGGDVSLTVDGNNVLHVSYDVQWAAGVIEITPTDEHGLSGDPCHFILYIGYFRDGNDDRYPAVILPIPDITVCATEDYDYDITDYIYQSAGASPNYRFIPEFNSAGVIVQRFTDTATRTKVFAHITSTQVGGARVTIQVQDGSHGNSNTETLVIFVQDCDPTTDSVWSPGPLRFATPPQTVDGPWAPLAEVIFDVTEDSNWSSLVFQTPTVVLAPTIDLKANGQDALIVATGTQVTISWVATNAVSVTLDLLDDTVDPVTGHLLTGSFSSVFTTIGTHVYQGMAIGLESTASDTVAVTVTDAGLPTQDSEWSLVAVTVTGPTQDSEWSLVAVTVTGPTQDSEWSLVAVTVTGPTQDSEWSLVAVTVTGPTQDSEWSLVAVTVTATELPTRDSQWSPPVPLSQITGPTIHSQWSVLIEQFVPGDHEIFIRSNDYLPCHDSGVYISWNITGANRTDRLAVFEDGSQIALLVGGTHSGEWAGTRYIPSRYQPGGNTVTYTLTASRRSTQFVVNQATVDRLTASVASLEASRSTALALLVTLFSARSAARTAYSSAVSATSSARTALDSAESTRSVASSNLSAAASIRDPLLSARDSTFSARSTAQSTRDSCIAENPDNSATACASEISAYNSAASAFSSANSAYNAAHSVFVSATLAFRSANSAYNSANSTYNSAQSAESSALSAQNSAESAYDTQVGVYNNLTAQIFDARFALARARTGVQVVIITDIISESIDVEWVFCDPTSDGNWSQLIGLVTRDSEWSPSIGLLTRRGEWSQLIGLVTRDSEWSEFIGLVTEHSEWSYVIGPIVCDGFWSPFAFLGNENSEWSELVGLITEDGEWSNVVGPIICDSAWSPWAVLTSEDGEWSDLATPPTTDGEWSVLVDLLTTRSEWSLIVELLYLDNEWSPVSNVAYAVRSSVSLLVSNSEWSKVSSMAYEARPGPPGVILHHSAWSSVSNFAYYVRPTITNIVYHGGWIPVAGPAYRVRPGNPILIFYATWSAVSNTAYRVRPGAPVPIVYHSAWSAVSNIARQEREVLSVIGGAEPFLHIYEARRGLVHVRRLVTSTNILVGTGLEEATVNTNRDSDRVLINPGITLDDLQTDDVAIDVYRTTNSAVHTTAYRFYIANLEGVDPNIRRVYYDVTPSTLFVGTMPYRIRVTATATGMAFQRAFENGNFDGNIIPFSFGGVTVPASAELVVVAVTPQHDDARLSRIVYRNQKVNNWYYYHGVPEIYVSEPLDIVANEDAFSYNGRDSANFQSPPHVGYASALVRQHQNTDQPWFEELLNRNHVITGQRVHMMLRDADGNYGKDFTGILQSPPLKHQDNIYDWRVSLQDPTTLMVQSFSNSATLLGPQDAMNTRTVGALIQRVAQSYADRVSGLTLDDVLDPNFAPGNFPVPLAWFWTDYESERDILQRLVNTQGPPTGFYVNDLGQMVFTGCEDRGSPIILGGANGIPVSQVVSFSDHVVDVANDARIPVSLHGWVLPDIATTPAQVYEEPNGLPEPVQVQLFETYEDNAIFDLARGGGIVFDSNGEYRYRVRTTAPVLPPTTGMPFRIVGVSSGVTVNQVAANLLEIVVTGTAGEAVPAFQVFGAELKYFRTIEHWTSPTVREENQTRFSRYLYHQREFSYGGYNSIALRDAQIMADWVVRYYRKGIKTMTLQLFCSGSAENVREGLRIQPDRTPVRINHNYGDAAPEQWIVRSRKRIYRDGHFWIEVVLDEDVMYSLGIEHSPLCDNYLAPTASLATYSANDSGELTYTGADGAGLIIPHAGLLSIAPNLAATVLPFSASITTYSIIKTSTTGAELFILTPGTWIAGGFNLRALQALDDSQFYVEGLRANGLTVWLVAPKVQGTDPYWGVMNLNLRADGITAPILLPAAFHFLRINYAAVGPQVDLVLSFISPPMTIYDATNHWITVAQEQPWLGDSAGDALTYQSHVVILDWQVFPMDGLGQAAHLGVAEGTTYVTDAVIFRGNGPPSSNVYTPSGGQILRKFGRA